MGEALLYARAASRWYIRDCSTQLQYFMVLQGPAHLLHFVWYPFLMRHCNELKNSMKHLGEQMFIICYNGLRKDTQVFIRRSFNMD